jgi:hypothetical protein
MANPYAFPVAWPEPNVPEPGMTLRDWFAGQALAMLPLIGETNLEPSEWAHDAYRMADAMLTERTKPHDE